MTHFLRPLLAALLLIAGVLWPNHCQATAQEPDLLVYHGDTLLMQANPLEAWVKQQDKRPPELQGNGSTDCWRGYVATWLLEDNHLYLMAVQPCGSQPLPAAVLQRWFLADTPRRIRADWVTGRLDVVRGRLLRYEHLGYGSIYEQDWLLTFASGQLVGQATFDNHGCGVAGPPGGATAFQQRLMQRINWRRVPVRTAGAGQRVFVEFRPDSTGHQCRVRLLKGAGAPYDSLALAAARAVAATEWGACYRFGRWLPESWTVPIAFTKENQRRYQTARPTPAR